MSLFQSLFPRATAVRAEELPTGDASAGGVPDDSATAKADDAGAPVQFENFSREWQGVSQQDNWDGFRLEGANQVTKHLQAAHTLFLGTQLRESGYIYQFGPAFQSEDGRTMLVARTGLDGAVNGRVIQKLGSRWELKASSNSHLKDAQRNMHEGSVEYTGSDWTAGGKLMYQGAWLLGAAYTQRVIPSLQLGGDLTLVVQNLVTIGQIGARWTQGKDIFTASLSRTPDPKSPFGGNLHECRLQYLRKVTERLSLGSEFKYSHGDQESGSSLAYEYTFRQARVQGLLDTEGKVSCCVSDFTGFGFSGSIDYFRGDYKFGVVMHVLPQPEGGGPPM
jgi:mitochondrial import receptor subunit TOM40